MDYRVLVKARSVLDRYIFLMIVVATGVTVAVAADAFAVLDVAFDAAFLVEASK